MGEMDNQNGGSKWDDPYERFLAQEKYRYNLIPYDTSTKFTKKWNKLKLKMKEAKANALNGFMMGCMIGGLFGGVIGVYTAFYTKRLVSIPISIIISGGSFGFILGCGSMIRSD